MATRATTAPPRQGASGATKPQLARLLAVKSKVLRRVEAAVPFLNDSICRIVVAYAQTSLSMSPTDEELAEESDWYCDYPDDKPYSLIGELFEGDTPGPELQSHPREYFTLIREVAQDFRSDLRFTARSLGVLQTSAEAFLTQVISSASKLQVSVQELHHNLIQMQKEANGPQGILPPPESACEISLSQAREISDRIDSKKQPRSIGRVVEFDSWTGNEEMYLCEDHHAEMKDTLSGNRIVHRNNDPSASDDCDAYSWYRGPSYQDGPYNIDKSIQRGQELAQQCIHMRADRAIEALIDRHANRKKKRKRDEAAVALTKKNELQEDDYTEWVEAPVGRGDIERNKKHEVTDKIKGSSEIQMGTGGSKKAVEDCTIASLKAVGLNFDVNEMAKTPQARSMTPSAIVYAASTLEYLAAEILELSGNACDDRIRIANATSKDTGKTEISERHEGVRKSRKRQKIITPGDIFMAISNDEELLKLMHRELSWKDNSDVKLVDESLSRAKFLKSKLHLRPPPKAIKTAFGNRLNMSPPMFASPSKLPTLWACVCKGLAGGNVSSETKAAASELGKIYRRDVNVVGTPTLVGFYNKPFIIPDELLGELECANDERVNTCCNKGELITPTEFLSSESAPEFCIFDVDVLTERKDVWKLRAEVYLHHEMGLAWFYHRDDFSRVGCISISVEQDMDYTCQAWTVAPFASSNPSSELTPSIFRAGVQQWGKAAKQKKWADVFGALSLLAFGWTSSEGKSNIVFDA